MGSCGAAGTRPPVVGGDRIRRPAAVVQALAAVVLLSAACGHWRSFSLAEEFGVAPPAHAARLRGVDVAQGRIVIAAGVLLVAATVLALRRRRWPSSALGLLSALLAAAALASWDVAVGSAQVPATPGVSCYLAAAAAIGGLVATVAAAPLRLRRRLFLGLAALVAYALTAIVADVATPASVGAASL